MIPSSRVRPSPKEGGYMGVSLKKANFLAKNAVCWPKIIFSETSSKFGGTLNRQLFCVDWAARRASGGPLGPIFGPKICIFLRYTHITLIFRAQAGLTE